MFGAGIACCLTSRLVAVMSILGATLTPGCRYRLDGGYGGGCQRADFLAHTRRTELGPLGSAGHVQGYNRAFVTILDANLTTLLVAVICLRWAQVR